MSSLLSQDTRLRDSKLDMPEREPILFDQKMKPLLSLIVIQIAITSAISAADEHEKITPKFAQCTVNLWNDPKLRFSFSASNATAKDPIVISAPGRDLTKADRKHRIELQKAWLSKHVPKKLQITQRVLVEIPFKRKLDKFSAADLYVFEDPATGKEFKYHIYVGNWP